MIVSIRGTRLLPQSLRLAQTRYHPGGLLNGGSIETSAVDRCTVVSVRYVSE